jgi:hypothetical protein
MNNFKKNSWMYAVIGMCIAFASLMISFAILASHHHIDLVVSDYYKEEIAYQKQINKINNYKNLTAKPDIQVDSIRDKIKIIFPAYNNDAPINGRICFYRPDDQKFDDTVALALNASGRADFSLDKYKKGKWKMKVEWQKDTMQYMVEQTFKLK